MTNRPFTGMNNSPDRFCAKRDAWYRAALFRRFPRYVKYSEFNDEKGDKSDAEKFPPSVSSSFSLPLSFSVRRSVYAVVAAAIGEDNRPRRTMRRNLWNPPYN